MWKRQRQNKKSLLLILNLISRHQTVRGRGINQIRDSTKAKPQQHSVENIQREVVSEIYSRIAYRTTQKADIHQIHLRCRINDASSATVQVVAACAEIEPYFPPNFTTCTIPSNSGVYIGRRRTPKSGKIFFSKPVCLKAPATISVKTIERAANTKNSSILRHPALR